MDLIARIVAILFPLFALVAIGYVVGRWHRPDLHSANRLNIDIFTPALVFAALTGQHVNVTKFFPLIFAGLVIIFGSALAGWMLARWLQESPRTLISPMMFNNCGNLGLPLAVLAFGDQGLAPMVVLFILSNLLQFSLGIWIFDRQAKVLNAWRVPSILAALAGLAVSMMQWTIWPPLMTAIRMLGDISIPLMLFSLGVRLVETPIRSWRLGLIVASARPIVGMILAAVVIGLFNILGGSWRFDALQSALLFTFGALPPAVVTYLFAERYGQEPDKVASIILIGNVATFVFLPIALGFSFSIFSYSPVPTP